MNRTGAQFNRVSGRIEKGSAVTAKVFTLGNSFELSGRDYYEKSIAKYFWRLSNEYWGVKST